MVRDIFIAVGAGILSALAALAFIGRVPGAVFLVYVAPLPLFLAGLGLGHRAGVIAASVGTLAAFAMVSMTGALMFAMIHALPAALLSWLALLQRPGPAGQAYWYPTGWLVSWLAVIAGAALMTLALFWWGDDGGLAAAIRNHLNGGLATLVPQIPPDQRARLVQGLTALFPGWVGVSWITMVVANAALAEAILTRAGRALRPKPAYRDLVLPEWLSWLIVGAAALALIGPGDLGYIGRNLAVVLALPYFFLGLATVHTLAARVQFKRPLLVGLYVILFLSAWALLVVAAVGVAEHWVGLRGRFAGAGPNKENE